MGKRWTGGIAPLLALMVQITWAVVCVVVPGLSGAVAQEAGKTAETSAEKPEVLFAIGEWPPMITENADGYGIHTKRVTEVFEALGYRVRYVFVPWRRAYEQTIAGEYAGTFSWIWTEERAAEAFYPRYPIANAHQKGFYRKDRFPAGLDIDEIADLGPLGLRPVGVASYWYEVEFRRQGIPVDIVTTSEAAWRFLDAGRADIYIEEEEVGLLDMARVLGEDALTRYEMTDPVQSDKMFILFSRKNPQGAVLRDAFDGFLDTPEGRAMCRGWGVCEQTASATPGPKMAVNGPGSGQESVQGNPVGADQVGADQVGGF
ncbi:ABC transporter substrate-binding protein [Thalassospira sp. MCCC 1A03138]|uniref:substrate-binding periplasmic protein n=1 Tax=Thalassospira sp. MCCC 1A03138 TaxID=1470576 RepID=UPI00143E0753|nr:transporter substrate-binding domain-containing protein [Thalassospira sp. MCCC 1A03138]